MRKVVASICALLLLAVGLSAPAGAGPIAPCPNGGNGWFDTWNPSTGNHAAINCSWQDNHIVVDMHDNGTWTQGVLDIWYPYYCVPVFQPTASGNSFTIKFRPTNQLSGKCWSNSVGNYFYNSPAPFEYVYGEYWNAPQWMGLNTMTFWRAYAANWNAPSISIDSPAGFIAFYERGVSGSGGVVAGGKWSHYWQALYGWDAEVRISIYPI